jgi:hypothetical protein
MPSLDDVFQELQKINGNLNTVHNDGLATKGAVDTGTVAVNNVRNSVDQAVQQLKALVVGQAYSNAALYHLTQQNDTIICILEHISMNTCALLNEAHAQTALQTMLVADTHEILAIEQSAHPAAALEAARLADLRKDVERCCPPPQRKPVCTYGPCPTSSTRLEPPKPIDEKANIK